MSEKNDIKALVSSLMGLDPYDRRVELLEGRNVEAILNYISLLEKKVERYEERIRLSSSAMSSAADFIRSSAYRAVAVVLDEFATNNTAALEEKGVSSLAKR